MHYFNNNQGQWNSLDIVANLLFLVPMGIYIHALSKSKSIIKSLFLLLFIIVFIESAQFVLATGSFDIDDILANFIGVLIFQLIYLLSKKDSELAKTVLSAISVTLIPVLIATVLEYGLWLPYIVIVPVSLLAFFIIYLGMYPLCVYCSTRSKRDTYA